MGKKKKATGGNREIPKTGKEQETLENSETPEAEEVQKNPEIQADEAPKDDANGSEKEEATDSAGDNEAQPAAVSQEDKENPEDSDAEADPKDPIGKRNSGKKKPTVKIIVISLIALTVVGALIGGYLWLQDNFAPEEPKISAAPPSPSPSPVVGESPSPSPSPSPNASPPSSPDGLRRENVYTVILGGTDLNDYHTDTLMVATLDSLNHTIDVLSIPRDTQVDVPWSIKRINAAWGAGEQDITLLKELLQTVIGFQPDYHVIVDLVGFVDLIDALGGVEYDVPQRMRYTDASQDLYIDLQPGLQHLDGDEAIQLVRFRDDYLFGDPERIALQQDFLTELFKQAVSAENVLKIPQLAGIVRDSVRTDLTTNNMTWFIQELLKVAPDDIRFHSLPGNPGAYWHGSNYHIVDAEETVRLVNRYISPFKEPITEENLNVTEYVDEYR